MKVFFITMGGRGGGDHMGHVKRLYKELIMTSLPVKFVMELSDVIVTFQKHSHIVEVLTPTSKIKVAHKMK